MSKNSKLFILNSQSVNAKSNELIFFGFIIISFDFVLYNETYDHHVYTSNFSYIEQLPFLIQIFIQLTTCSVELTSSH